MNLPIILAPSNILSKNKRTVLITGPRVINGYWVQCMNDIIARHTNGFFFCTAGAHDVQSPHTLHEGCLHSVLLGLGEGGEGPASEINANATAGRTRTVRAYLGREVGVTLSIVEGGQLGRLWQEVQKRGKRESQDLIS